jgi:drug/metabolite transporter (DMT)-like permease
MFGAILLSLYAHVGFAANDLTGAIGSRKLTAARMTLYAWLCGCVLMVLSVPFLFRNSLSLRPLLVNAVLALIMAIAYPLFLYTLQHGNATINGVIAGTFPIWVVLLSLLFFDETLTAVQAGCILVIFVGVILSTLHLTRRTRLHNLFSRSSLLALVVSLMWGIYFAFIRIPIEQYGWFEANVVTQVFATLASLLLLLPIIRRSKPLKFQRKQLTWPAINASAGFTSSLAYNYALTLGNSSIVAPIAGSYPGLYALASYFIFKESLTRLQVAGLLLVLSGVIGLSFASL